MYDHDSYFFAFGDNDGNINDVHISDDLQSIGTWEYIDMHFSLPHSKYILIWRRDHKKITRKNADVLFKYIKDNMKEFSMEGVDENATGVHDDENGGQVHIRRKLTRDHDCLILAWDKMALPEQFSTWTEFLSWAYDLMENEICAIGKPNSRHDRELAIYEGRIIID